MTSQTAGNYLLFLFILLILLGFRDNQAARDELARIIDATRNLTQALKNETYNANSTKSLPDELQRDIRHLLALNNETTHGRYYQNITGTFRGQWQGKELALAEHNGTYNESNRGQFLFNSSGNAIMSLATYPTRNTSVAFIEGSIRLDNERESDRGAYFFLEGLHYQQNGTIFLVGAPNNTAEASNITALMPDEAMFNETKSVLLGVYDKRIAELEAQLARGEGIIPGQDQMGTEETGCYLRLYLQLKAIAPDIALSDVAQYEKELHHPTGMPVMSMPPPLEASLLSYSNNCGIEITASSMDGMLVGEFYHRVALLSIAAAIVGIAQILLMISQMEYTQTPTGITKIAYWTITLQCIMDGYVCVGLLTAALVLRQVFLPLVTAAFFALVLITICEVRYWGLVRRIQLLSGDSDSSDNSAYIRFYVLAICSLLVYWMAGSRSVAWQEIVLGIGFVIGHSSWWPQVWRNIQRGTRKPFQKRYIIGMTMARLACPLYMFACPENLIYHRSTPWIWTLVAYDALQVIVLCIQDRFGPRFLVPQRFLPQVYNYHPILPTPDDVEAATESRDCCICMRPVEIVPRDHMPGSSIGLARNAYMLTPCDHLFHTPCLEQAACQLGTMCDGRACQGISASL
ncbi:hypothetical protein SYNPS1DRAFT_29140 [Syncephalis pseudoplumigaleata]|uniref:RING-type E3 ubiquitin transferase n=1 Tax=Syncephalis pseudoplumigaleata TaxID=1712513 RepID=A0A4P9YYE1_9FUNG|nr:hypothetical protein SYNPS1DRAFT_29140 [Syncephalis pseudoplumigaleata]|eukprot:RKP25117.1 hypothetical protein SYNPS1DRAFT_29140 [Syncephalis pseudoplumigaleata]